MKKNTSLLFLSLFAISSITFTLGGCKKDSKIVQQETNKTNYNSVATGLVWTKTVTKKGCPQQNGGCNDEKDEICETVVTATQPLITPPPTGTTWSGGALDENGNLVIRLYKAYMSNAWQSSFSNSNFTLSETLIIGSDVMSQITGVPNSTYTINAGTYSYSEDSDWYYVTF